MSWRRGGRRAAFAGLLVASLLAATGATQAVVDDEPAEGEKQAVVSVRGMQCPFCAYGIKKHLEKLPGATAVEVELAKNEAIITFEADADVTDQAIEEAVRKAGFTPGDISWSDGDSEETGGRGTDHEPERG